MMNLIIFGNSHVGAWREAWPTLAPDYPDINVTFFGIPEMIHRRYRIQDTGVFSALKISDDERKRVVDINGFDKVQLKDYDRHLWVGMNWKPESAVMITAFGDPDTIEDASTGRPAYSTPFLKAIFELQAANILRDSKVNLDGSIRPDMHPRPIYAEECQSSLHPLYGVWRETANIGSARSAILGCYEEIVVDYFSKHGLKFVLIPKSLSSRSGATKSKYLSVGGGIASLKTPASRGDFSHMNAEYGRVCLKNYLDHYFT